MTRNVELHEMDEELEQTIRKNRAAARAAAEPLFEEKYNEVSVDQADNSPTPVFSPIISSQSPPSTLNDCAETAPVIESGPTTASPNTEPQFLPLPLLWQYIPRRAKQSFRELMRSLLTEYKIASMQQRTDERDKIIEKILDVPRNYLLMKPRRKKRGTFSSDKLLNQKLRDTLDGDQGIKLGSESSRSLDGTQCDEQVVERRRSLLFLKRFNRILCYFLKTRSILSMCP